MSSDPADESDADLWRSVRADDDRDAFAQIYLRHVQRVFRYCFRRTASIADAEDLTSIVFLEMWRCRRKVAVHADGTVLPWLYGAATNFIRKNEHTRRRRQGALARMRVDTVADPADEVAARVDDERRMQEILNDIDDLSQPDQEILTLCVWEGLDTQSAADALGIPTRTVKSRLSRARARVRSAAENKEV